MKKYLPLLSFILAVLNLSHLQSTIIKINNPSIILNDVRPIHVIIIDQNRNSYEETVYYDPALGGIDVDTALVGPNASIYIPDLDLGYIWYNGFWVDQDGYYWNGERRVYIENPSWKRHWEAYWNTYPMDHKNTFKPHEQGLPKLHLKKDTSSPKNSKK